jgi:hypothetical protein
MSLFEGIPKLITYDDRFVLAYRTRQAGLEF